MVKEKKQPSIRRNAVLNMGRTLLSIIFPIMTFPYATRILLPEGIGKTQFAFGIVSYFVMVAGLGIGTYGIRETAKQRDDVESLGKVTKELFLLNLIPTSISYILFGITLLVVPKLSAYRSLLIVYSATILFTTLGIEWLYVGMERYSYITLRQLFFQICSLMALFVFVRQKEDVLKYAAISVFANVGANTCNFVHSRKYIKWGLPAKLEITRHLKPVFILFGTRIAASLYVTLDTTLLGFLTDDAQVGYYEAANKMARVVVSLITSVITVTLPRLSYYVEKKDISSYRVLLEQSFDILILFALPLSAGLFLLGKNIILIISGFNFLPALPAMRVLSLLVLMIPLSSFFGNQIFIPLGKERISLYAMLTGAVVNIVLSIIFIKRHGAFGAAFASLIAETSIALFYFVASVRQKLFSCKPASLVHCVVGVAVMIMGISLVNQSGMAFVPRTVMSVIAGMLFYASVMVVMRDKAFLYICNCIRTKIKKKQL